MTKSNEAHKIIKGLMQDIGEVLERMGEDWWDETVTSGILYRELALAYLYSRSTTFGDNPEARASGGEDPYAETNKCKRCDGSGLQSKAEEEEEDA